MALVVDVEAVVDGVVLEVGDEPGDVDDGHGPSLPRPARRSPGDRRAVGCSADATTRRCSSVLHDAAARRPDGARRARRLGPGRHPARASTTATWPPTRRPSRVLEAAGRRRAERGVRAGHRTATGRWWSCSTRSTAAPTPAAGLPWYATSLCAVDADGPRAALVVDQADGARVRGRPGRRRTRSTARPLAPSGCTDLAEAIVGLSGYPPRSLRLAAVPRPRAPSPSTCARSPTGGSTPTSTAARAPTGRGTTSAALLVCQRGRRCRRRRRSAATSSPSTTRPAARRSPPPPPRCSSRWRLGRADADHVVGP